MYPKFTGGDKRSWNEMKQLIQLLHMEIVLEGERSLSCWWDIMKESSSFDDKGLFYETKIKHHHLILVHMNELLFKENMS